MDTTTPEETMTMTEQTKRDLADLLPPALLWLLIVGVYAGFVVFS